MANIFFFEVLPVGEEDDRRFRNLNQDCLYAIKTWAKNNPDHSVRVVQYIEDAHFNRVFIRAESEDTEQKDAVQDIINRLYTPVTFKT